MRIAIMVLIGCGGGSGGLPLDNLARELAEVHCAQLARCCDADERQDIPPDCVGTFAAVFEEEGTAALRDAVTAGRLEFDAAQAVECVAHVESLSCGDFSAWMVEEQAAVGVPCLTMLRGVLAIGETCTRHYECQSGSCGGFDFETQRRLCDAAGAEGAACNRGCLDFFDCERCEGDLLCDQTTSTCESDPAIVPGEFCDGAPMR